MTTTTDPTGGQEATVTPSPLDALRTVRATRGKSVRRPVKRAPAPKRPPVSRADSAAKKGKYADRIAAGIKTGCALLGTRAPLQARLIEAQAQAWGTALDRVAAEDKRVDALLTTVSGWFGKSSAWGELGGVAAVTTASLLLSTGMTPAGPAGIAVVFLGGKALEQGVRQLAVDQASDLLADNGITPDMPDYAANLTALANQLVRDMMAEIHAKSAAARADQLVPDDPTPTTAIPDDQGAEQVQEPAWLT